MKKIPRDLIGWWAEGNGSFKIFPAHLESLLEDLRVGEKKRCKRYVVIGLIMPLFMYVQYLSAGKSFNSWLIVSMWMSLILFRVISIMVKKTTSLQMPDSLIVNSFIADVSELCRIGKIGKHLVDNMTYPDPVLSKSRYLTEEEMSRCAGYMLVALHDLALRIRTCGDSDHSISVRLHSDLISGLKLMKKFQLAGENVQLTDFDRPTGPVGIWSDPVSMPPTGDSS